MADIHESPTQPADEQPNIETPVLGPKDHSGNAPEDMREVPAEEQVGPLREATLTTPESVEPLFQTPYESPVKRWHGKRMALIAGGMAALLGTGIGIGKAMSDEHTAATAEQPQNTSKPQDTPKTVETPQTSPSSIPAEFNPDSNGDSIPDTLPTLVGPSSGNINLIASVEGDNDIEAPLPGNASDVELPNLRNPNNVTPTDFVNSFLMNLAYYETTDNEDDAEFILTRITDDDGVREYLQGLRQATQARHDGSSNIQELVEYWDTKSYPAVFEKTTNEHGDVISLTDGQVNVTNLSTNDPVNPTEVQWQTGQNHDPSNSGIIYKLDLAYHENSDGAYKITWMNLQINNHVSGQN